MKNQLTPKVLLKMFLAIGLIANLTYHLQAQTGVAELPRATVDTAMPTMTGRTLTVNAGGDLQAALNAAQPGDQVVLQAGATFVGNFVLPAKPGIGSNQWIVVRTSGQLPSEGTRVSPADAIQMPKLLTPNAARALEAAPGAQGWRLVGLEITAVNNLTMTYSILAFGTAGSEQSTHAQVPSRMIVDRSYVHGTPILHARRCVMLNSAQSAVIDSYISECHSNDGDSQAIMGWNGPGPYKIVNNYLEAGHEVIAFGGADPSIPNMIPSDIEIRGNHVTRPLSWKGVWLVKNLVEFKAGQRILMEGNVFENNWVDAQNGFSFLWWSVNPDGGCPWCVTQDVTFRYNRIKNIAGGFNIGAIGSTVVVPMNRVTIAHNVITGMDASNGRLYQIIDAPAGVTIVNNTAISVNIDLLFGTPDKPLPSLVFHNNITGAQYNFFASQYGMGASALAGMQIPAENVAGNVVVTSSPGNVPPGNVVTGSSSNIGFVNEGAGDMRLSSNSPYLTSGTNSSTPGADVEMVEKLTANVISGNNQTPAPTPTPQPTPAPTPPSLTCPAPASNAFTACYYLGRNFDQLKHVTTEPSINQNWGLNAPNNSLPADNYSVRWAGSFTFESGDYQFNLTTDDGMRVFIDNELAFERWFEQQNSYEFTRTMAPGVHTIRVEYYENSGFAEARLGISILAASAPQPIPLPTPVPAVDSQAPSTPTGLVATSVAQREINFVWQASQDNVGVTGYRIFRNNSLIATTTTTNYMSLGLTPGTTYSFTIQAVDASGNVSAQSAPLRVVTKTLKKNNRDSRLN